MTPTSRTKVAIFGPALKAVSGVSTHVRLLLESTLQERFDMYHFQVGSEGRTESSLQRIWRFAVSPLQLAYFIFRNQIEVVHINTSMNRKAFWRDLSYLMVARLLRRRVVTQFHSGADPKDLFGRSLQKSLFRHFLVASNVVAVLSTDAVRSYRMYEPRVKVVLVPNAIEAAGLLDCERPIKEPNEPLKLLFLGRIVRSKGILDTIAAMKLLKDEGVLCDLRIAGVGDALSEVKSLIEALDLGASVHLVGPVFGVDKNSLWLDSDIHIFPTYHNEGLPYSILESLAAGCVPVTCPVAAIPDVMNDGIHGIFVPPRDPAAIAKAIRHLFMHRDELATMAQAGRRRIAEDYTIDRLAARIGAIYDPVSS